jgi:hypothetical protein
MLLPNIHIDAAFNDRRLLVMSNTLFENQTDHFQSAIPALKA